MAYRATPAANSIGFSQYFLCFAKDIDLPFDTVINSTVDASPNFMSYWPQTILDLRCISHSIPHAFWPQTHILSNKVR